MRSGGERRLRYLGPNSRCLGKEGEHSLQFWEKRNVRLESQSLVAAAEGKKKKKKVLRNGREMALLLNLGRQRQRRLGLGEPRTQEEQKTPQTRERAAPGFHP